MSTAYCPLWCSLFLRLNFQGFGKICAAAQDGQLVLMWNGVREEVLFEMGDGFDATSVSASICITSRNC